MNIEVKIDKNYENPQILILANKMTTELSVIIDRISNITQKTLQTYKDQKLYILNQSEIESIYSENGKVYVICSNEIYSTKNRLYEIENLLDLNSFILLVLIMFCALGNANIYSKNIEMLNIIIMVCLYTLTGLIFCIRNSIDKNLVNKFNQKLQEKNK